MSTKKMMNTILMPLVQELVSKAYGSTLVQDLDCLLQNNTLGVNRGNNQNNTLYQEFKQRCAASKALTTQKPLSNRKQLLQFSEK